VGSDFIYDVFVVPAIEDKHTPSLEPLHWDAAKKFIEDELTLEDDEQRIFNDLEEFRDHMRERLDELEDGYLDRRDVGYILHKGEWIILAGGLSWGDSPSDAYNIINDLRCGGVMHVLETGERWMPRSGTTA